MLSRKEREYLKGKLNLEPYYEHKLVHSIRKKVPKALQDLTLIFEKLDATKLHFYKEEYYNVAVPLLRAIQEFELKEHFFEEIHDVYLASALEKAGKRFNYKKLALDRAYRQRMIDWLVKNSIEFWKPPPLEEQKRRFEKFKRVMVSQPS